MMRKLIGLVLLVAGGITACSSPSKTVADPTTASVGSVVKPAETSTSTASATTAGTEVVTTKSVAAGTEVVGRICKAIKLAEGLAEGGNADYYKVQFGIQLGQEFLADALTSSPITDEPAVQRSCPTDYAALLNHSGAKSLAEVLQP
jgi:hypothetical protein